MKYANLIVVGGPISVGKSTLVNSLGLPQVQELDQDDKLQTLLLEMLYKKERMSPELIELYFLNDRLKKYRDFSALLQTHVLDRSILESLWFARGTLSPRGYELFARLWEKEVKDLFEEYGKPKLYILLTMNWDTFRKRIFARDREVEVKNFRENEEYFRKHIKEYEEWMENIYKKFDVNFIKIHTDELNAEQVREIALKEVKKVLEENCNQFQ